jgi:hypothetical protein
MSSSSIGNVSRASGEVLAVHEDGEREAALAPARHERREQLEDGDVDPGDDDRRVHVRPSGDPVVARGAPVQDERDERSPSAARTRR